METADVVIIGGGIVGASIAWHLTEAGCRNVLIVERESHQGKGSTGKSMGGVRAQFATAPNIQMSLYSIPFFAQFDERLGQPGRLSPARLPVRRDRAEASRLPADQSGAAAVKLGLKQASMVTPRRHRRPVPQLRSDDILGGSFCPTDGFVDPYSVMAGFTTCAVERGAKLWRSTEVTAIHRDGKGITGVETTRGPVSTRVSSTAAGAWAARSQRWPASIFRSSRSAATGSDRAFRRRLARDPHGHRHD